LRREVIPFEEANLPRLLFKSDTGYLFDVKESFIDAEVDGCFKLSSSSSLFMMLLINLLRAFADAIRSAPLGLGLLIWIAVEDEAVGSTAFERFFFLLVDFFCCD
jgi:hypothetical protein